MSSLFACVHVFLDRGLVMLKGVLVGFGIMVASIPVPVVHFIAVPLSPFIAGFIGGGMAKPDQNGVVKFGALMAGLMFIPALVMLLLKYVVGVEELLGFPSTLWVIVILALIPYTWFGTTVGALGSYLIRQNHSKESL